MDGLSLFCVNITQVIKLILNGVIKPWKCAVGNFHDIQIMQICSLTEHVSTLELYTQISTVEFDSIDRVGRDVGD